jgi:hypothetical protein
MAGRVEHLAVLAERLVGPSTWYALRYPSSAVAVVVTFLGTFSADLCFGACKGLVSDYLTSVTLRRASSRLVDSGVG